VSVGCFETLDGDYGDGPTMLWLPLVGILASNQRAGRCGGAGESWSSTGELKLKYFITVTLRYFLCATFWRVSLSTLCYNLTVSLWC